MQLLSTYASLLAQNNAMINTSYLTTKLSNELSTGKKAVDLSDNPDHLSILDLTQTKDEKESYIKSCTLSQITTSQYTPSLQHIESIATTAQKAVQNLMSSTTGRVTSSKTGIPGDQDLLNKYKDLSQTITQALNDLTISLNEQSSSGSGYLYSGLRNPSSNPAYTVPPVRDLNSLPYFLGDVSEIIPGTNPPLDNTSLPAWPPAPATAVAPPSGNAAGPTPAPNAPSVDPIYTDPSGPANLTNTYPLDSTGQPILVNNNPIVTGLPTYDSDFTQALTTVTTATGQTLPSQQQMAWGVQKVTIDNNETVSLNIQSTAPAFQNLINGLRAAKTAADQADNYSTAVRDKYMSLAYSSINAAINGGSYTITDPASNVQQSVWDTGIRGLEQKNSITDLAIQNKSNLHTTDLNTINTRLDLLVGVDTTTVTVELATLDNQLQATYKVTASMLNMSLTNYLK